MAQGLGIEPEAFRAFEHAGWQRVAAVYDDTFESLTTQSVAALLDAANVRRGGHLLDVATGPGYVARAALERGAYAVGVDFSSAMIARARHAAPGVEFEEADATALPFADASFDAVTMNYGLLHLAEPELALSEARRVLKPGGRFAFAVWASPMHARGLGIVLEAVREHGDLGVPLPAGPPFFRFSEHSEARHVLLERGFAQPHVIDVAQTWYLPSIDALFDAVLRGTVRTAGLLRAQTPQALARIRAAVAEASTPHRHADGLALPMPAVVASALKR
ncbi:MAG: methyltransferase domain-containing protein [Polyangiaceae bacterium]